MILTIYRPNETLEFEIKGAKEAHYPSGQVLDFINLDTHESIKIRPYYRRRYNGVMNVFCEEEPANDED